jgi:NitT/TauT family transport system substrate-binding protein
MDRAAARGRLSRRQFVQSAGGLGLSAAGFALLAGCSSRAVETTAADASLETTTIRLLQPDSICQASALVADELLRAEGFADIQYIRMDSAAVAQALVTGEADITIRFGAPLLMRIDAGDPIVILAGAHVGCLELFGNARVRAMGDLKGKTVAAGPAGSPLHVSTAMMAAYVGLDPNKDINWWDYSATESMRLFVDGKVDAVMLAPPYSQELRAQQIGRVLVNTGLDRPWSQYFCCVVAANRDFIRRRPVATKRALRALLKASDFCTSEPERAAQTLIDRGLTTRYDYALQTMTELSYGKWREYDAEDALRFYALRLHEAGMVQSTPDKLLTQGTDWRVLAELKRELRV